MMDQQFDRARVKALMVSAFTIGSLTGVGCDVDTKGWTPADAALMEEVIKTAVTNRSVYPSPATKTRRPVVNIYGK